MPGILGEPPGPMLQIDPNAQQMHPGPGILGRSFAGPKLPRTPQEIDPNMKIELGTLHRGMEAGASNQLRSSMGDLGQGAYVTPHKWLAESYGGGPNASIAAGTRVVQSFNAKSLYPEDVAYIFGGSRYDEPIQLVSGNGIPLWEGPYSSQNIEKQLAGTGIKAVIGTPNSVGINQISVRDPSILSPIK